MELLVPKFHEASKEITGHTDELTYNNLKVNKAKLKVNF